MNDSSHSIADLSQHQAPLNSVERYLITLREAYFCASFDYNLRFYFRFRLQMLKLATPAPCLPLAALNLSLSFAAALLFTVTTVLVLKIRHRQIFDRRLGIPYGWSPSTWHPFGFELTVFALLRENPHLGNGMCVSASSIRSVILSDDLHRVLLEPDVLPHHTRHRDHSFGLDLLNPMNELCSFAVTPSNQASEYCCLNYALCLRSSISRNTDQIQNAMDFWNL